METIIGRTWEVRRDCETFLHLEREPYTLEGVFRSEGDRCGAVMGRNEFRVWVQIRIRCQNVPKNFTAVIMTCCLGSVDESNFFEPKIFSVISAAFLGNPTPVVLSSSSSCSPTVYIFSAVNLSPILLYFNGPGL